MARRTPRTKSGQPADLVPGARHVVLPDGIASSGWPAVRDTAAGFGVSFDPWQHGSGRVILAKRADGTFAASIGGVVISIPRQVGKTFLIGAIVFALCLLYPGITVIWTAHRLRTANETFASMRAFSLRKKIRPHMLKPTLGSGDEAVNFRNGSRILFGARERGFGVGFAQVAVLVLDEAQRVTETAMDDLVPTLNQAPHPFPLLILTGTPPRPTDPGDVFGRARADALGGEFADGAYIEFSADRDCNPMDRKQWKKANPSYPDRTPEAALLRMRKNLTAESFMREALGVWDEEESLGEIPRWAELHDPASVVLSNPAWSLAVSPLELGTQWACFGLAGRRADGRLHVEALDHRAGTWWVVDRAKQIFDEKLLPLRVRKTGAEGALIDRLREAGVDVEEVSQVDAAQACGAFIAACSFDDDGNPQLHHLNDPDLNKAVRRGVRRTSSSGSSVWDELKSKHEITPLIAVTVAAGGVPSELVEPPRVWSLADFPDLV